MNIVVEDYLERDIIPSFSDLCYTDEAGLQTHSYEITLVAENNMREYVPRRLRERLRRSALLSQEV